jgi:coenzyme F420 hydrogenase subunit beta
LFPQGEESAWGRSIAAYTVRPLLESAGVQDGGITSLLAAHILETDVVDAVLVTGRGDDWRPFSYWATEPAEVFAAAGSKYSTAPALEALSVGAERFERMAVIALPCQCDALRRLEQVRPAWSDKLVLTIGLFCTETFWHPGLVELVERELDRSVAHVDAFAIQRGRLIVRAGDDTAEWRLRELDEIAWPICHACEDLSAEMADIAIGSIGSPEGRNTVIVRTPEALALLRAGEEAGLWAMGPVERPELLVKLCERKRASSRQLPEERRTRLGRDSVRSNWKRRDDGSSSTAQ